MLYRGARSGRFPVKLLGLDYNIFTCVGMGLSTRFKSLPDNVRDSQSIGGNGQRGIDAAARWEK